MSHAIQSLHAVVVVVSIASATVPAAARQGETPQGTRVAVALQDGVTLATDVYLPRGAGPHPAVLVRTPYGTAERSSQGAWLAARGYAVVLQNVRGTGGSGGRFMPMLNERADGVATVDWIVRQPWSDGRVVLWGPSYSGNAAFLVAAAGHPAVMAMAHLSGWGDNRSFLYRDGAFQLMSQLPWVLQYGLGRAPAADAWDDLFRTTPLASVFGPLRGALPALLQPFPWAGIRVPVLHLTGFHDFTYRSTLEAHARIGAAGVDQSLVLGPWSHNQIWMDATAAGDEDFGPASRWGFEPVMETVVAWFDRHLGRVPAGGASSAAAPVRVFVMGENRWHDLRTWPPAELEYRALYLGGSGTLSATAPVRAGADRFVYNPLDPVPTLGGAVSHFFPGLLGVRDQRALGARADVLRYTSDPLAEGITLAGPLRAVIHASTDGRDTDFTAKLVEVRPDGYARIIEEGIVRGRFRAGMDHGAGTLLEPGRTYAFEIDLGATAVRIGAGSRIRVEVSSSNFPQYDRNPNTGGDALEVTEFRVAHQTVHHGPATPSRIILPVWCSQKEAH